MPDALTAVVVEVSLDPVHVVSHSPHTVRDGTFAASHACVGPPISITCAGADVVDFQISTAGANSISPKKVPTLKDSRKLRE